MHALVLHGSLFGSSIGVTSLLARPVQAYGITLAQNLADDMHACMVTSFARSVLNMQVGITRNA